MARDYTIRAYRPVNKGGGLLIETWHIGTGSRDVEIQAFQRRMTRGEVSHIDVIAHVEPFGVETIYPRASPDTETRP